MDLLCSSWIHYLPVSRRLRGLSGGNNADLLNLLEPVQSFCYVTGLAYHKHCLEASGPPKTPSHAYTRLVLGVVTYFAGSLPQLGLACVWRAGSTASSYVVCFTLHFSYAQLVGFSVSAWRITTIYSCCLHLLQRADKLNFFCSHNLQHVINQRSWVRVNCQV